ncbi:uncharacterized protein [Littorina saxatilis]
MARLSRATLAGVLCLVVLCFSLPHAASSLNEKVQVPSQYGDFKEIKKVHMVFMNHLDVGYDGIHPTVGFALNVVNRYFTEYFPRAVTIAEGLRVFGFRERFIYTTHPWLLYWYLHCSPVTLASNVTLQCPNKMALASVRGAISRGDIVWHAGPMNMQYEAMHPKLFDLSLNFSPMLDQEFNISRTTPVVSQRDVPGMTKAVIPHLKKHKIAAISVGVNTMTSPPAVPRTPFIWKVNPKDSDEDGVIAFWHPGGYPNNAGVFPAKPGGLSANDCHFAQDRAAFPEVLCFAFRTDNSGPPTNISEVLNNFEVARSQFPNAMIVASSLDDYVSALKASATTFPVVTQEIGDTWIMGIQSDPKKIAMYRTFADVLAECFDNGGCTMKDPRVLQAVHYLTKVPEHTWGLDSVGDYKNWTNQEFQKARSGKGYRDCEAAWTEQRQFMDLATRSLGNHPITKILSARLKELAPNIPDVAGYKKITALTEEQTCSNGMRLQFASDGSLMKLYEPSSTMNWAADNNRMGQLLYSTYNETDYDNMSKLYDYLGGAGFHKINSTQYAHPESRSWGFSLQGLYRSRGANDCDFLVEVAPSDKRSVNIYGVPPLFFIEYKSVPPGANARAKLEVVLQWFAKGPTRLSEALSFGFTPVSNPGLQWTMSKLDGNIDPMNVILNGSQYLHAINTGVVYTDPQAEVKGLNITSQDVALLTLATTSRPPSVFPVPLTTPSEIRTAAFNLYNNLWNTNYIYWYPYSQEDGDFKARFGITFL